ncbi:hypothetical protein H5410_047105, partial [Solanum commersonii]
MVNFEFGVATLRTKSKEESHYLYLSWCDETVQLKFEIEILKANMRAQEGTDVDIEDIMGLQISSFDLTRINNYYGQPDDNNIVHTTRAMEVAKSDEVEPGERDIMMSPEGPIHALKKKGLWHVTKKRKIDKIKHLAHSMWALLHR